jgi:O-antigen/teichoic acid export membrane protein
MFSFGSRLLAAGLIYTLCNDMYTLVIGKLFSPVDLGFYARGNKLQQLPSQSFATVVQRVMFPVFCTIQDDNVRLKRAFRKALTTLVLVNFPMMIGLALTAKPLVLLLLTDKWLPCVPYMQLFCVVGLLYPLQAINLVLLRSKGRSDLILRLNVIKNVLRLVALAITFRWGIEVIIWGQVVLALGAYGLNSHYTGVLIRYPASRQIRDLLPYLGIAGAMGAGIHAVQYTGLTNTTLLLFLQILTGVTSFTLLCSLFRLSAFWEAWHTCKERLSDLTIT